MSKPAAEYVDPASLVPWARNPRRNDAAVAALAAEIERDGWGAPIVARLADRRIIAGHTRWKAARKLGLAEVPVRFIDVDEAMAQRLALADNKLGELAEWDDAALAAILRDLAAEEVDLAGLGWDDDTLDLLIKGSEAVGVDEWGNALGGLPAGDRSPIQTMTFTLHDEQAATVKRAIEAARGLGAFGKTGNENGNGNALARVCETFLTTTGA